MDTGSRIVAAFEAAWNTIEHRLFSHIPMNWRGRPLVSHEVLLELIAATRTRSGPRVQAELDQGRYPRYPLGVRVSGWELAAVPLQRHDRHGEWNCTVLPDAITAAAVNLVVRDPYELSRLARGGVGPTTWCS